MSPPDGAIAAPDSPDVVVGFRLKRADPPSGAGTPASIACPTASSSASEFRDIDCACKLFKRGALEPIRVASGGAFFTAELLIKLRFEGRRIAEVGVPHYPRTAGSPTARSPAWSSGRYATFWSLRLRLLAGPLERGWAAARHARLDTAKSAAARAATPAGELLRGSGALAVASSRSTFQRVDELRKTSSFSSTCVSGSTPASPGQPPRRRSGPRPNREASESDGRASTRRWPSAPTRAWRGTSSSDRLEMITPPELRAQGGQGGHEEVVGERRSGETACTVWRWPLASQGPIQIGR